MNNQNNAAEICTGLNQVLPDPEQIFEVRAIPQENGSPRIAYFSNPEFAGEAIQSLGDGYHYYYTLNNLNETCAGRLDSGFAPGSSTKNSDIKRRVILPIDIDPDRGIEGVTSATDEEKSKAYSVLQSVTSYLSGKGFPEPVTVDSGNGYYALYRLDLDIDQSSTQLVIKVLEHLADTFDSEHAHIDRTVHNLARILRVPYSKNIKGKGTVDRPHRFCEVLSRPQDWQVVPTELLRGLVPCEPEDQLNAFETDSGDPKWIMDWVERHKSSLPSFKEWQKWGGGWKLVFDRCPFNAAHKDTASYITVDSKGRISAGCHHNSCAGNDWHFLRKMIQPDAPPRKRSMEEHLKDFNDRFCVIGDGNCTIIEERDSSDEDSVIFWTVYDFHQYHSNLKASYANDESGTLHHVSRCWFAHPARRNYSRLVFDPSGQNKPDSYNLWNGFAVKAQEGEWGRIRHHIREIICAGNNEHYEFLMDLLADMVQRPHKKPGIAVVMRGKQGVGKGLFMHIIQAIVGKHYIQITDNRQLTSKFNSVFKNALVVFADEAFFHGEKGVIGLMKGLITEKKIILERKNVDAKPIDNHIHLFLSSNDDHVIPAEITDRRHFVLDVSSKHIGDRNYFAELSQEINNGGASAFLHHLMQLDLKAFPRKIPQTNALIDQKLRNLHSVSQWWYEILIEERYVVLEQDGYVAYNANGPTEIKTLHDSYRLFCKNRCRFRYAEEYNIFCINMQTICPSIRKKRSVIGGARLNVFQLPALDVARAEFENYVGFKGDWDAPDVCARLNSVLMDDP